MQRWLLLLALLQMGCSPAIYTWPNRYHRRFKPGDDAAQDAGPARVILTAETGALIAPTKGVKFTAQIHGDASSCRWVVWSVAGSSVSKDTMCNRAETRSYDVRCVGRCASWVAVYDGRGRELARDEWVIEVAGGDE